MKREIVYMDLFSGTGGFAKGLLEAGFIFKKHYFSEIDKFAISNYIFNFKNAKYVGGINKATSAKIERPDLISFGSPCDDISIASQGKGLEGEKSKLFFKAIEVIKRFRPRCFIFENVRNIFSSNKGKDFKTLLETIAKIGIYDIQWQLINSSILLPQNRERFYLVGYIREESTPKIFPLETYFKKGQKIIEKGDKKIITQAHAYKSNQGGRIIHPKGISPTVVQDITNAGFVPDGNSFRKLTPIEIERLQGFQDNWTKFGLFDGELKELSDTQRYFLLGNAVSLSIVKQIGMKLLPKATSLNGIKNEGFYDLPEMIIKFKRDNSDKYNPIKNSQDAANTFRSFFEDGELEFRENMFVLYLNRANIPLGYYRLSIGGISGTVADPKIILGAALKSLSSSIMIAHNHPSGNIKPSQADINLTKELSKSAEAIGLTLLDSLIITKNDYTSFVDEGLMGPNSPYPLPIDQDYIVRENLPPEDQFIKHVVNNLRNSNKLTRLQLEKKGRDLGITDKREVKELTEFGVLRTARNKINGKSPIKAYNSLVDLYKIQPNSSYRSSTVAIMRQYSTPLPISYLLGKFINDGRNQSRYLEPSAGNGLLTIGLPPNQTHVNELDELRLSVLRRGDFWAITGYDASMPMQGVYHNYDGVISNPPFGRLEEPYSYKGIELHYMDHLMMLRALEGMKDEGRAAFVTGAHVKFDHRGRITKSHGRAFFSYLYSNYNVIDMIPVDGKALYSRQGTGLDIMLILIDGRKKVPTGFPPTKSDFDDTVIMNHEKLYARISKYWKMKNDNDTPNLLTERAKKLLAKFGKGELGAPYQPTSEGCVILNTEVPDTMAFEMHDSLAKIKKKVGGDLDNFVRHRLGYQSKRQLCDALSAEQTDAVAMSIYNIEAKSQGCIIGDQTGIGKGRVAAAILRYAVLQGFIPIFLTEKVNLLSDLYRDLIAIGSGHLVPFIVNARDAKSNIKDPNGKIIYQAPSKGEQTEIFNSNDLENYDLVLATYSQFNSSGETPKKNFLKNKAKNAIIIMDESHNASGSSNTGTFMQTVVSESKSTIFLSATYAKRPENMPIYALKTAISDANMHTESLIYAIERGGNALQEIVASQLVAEGQMIRRERSISRVKVDYRVLEQKKAEHYAIADNITAIMRDIIAFQESYISPLINEKDKEYAKLSKELRTRGGTTKLGMSNTPYFSKIFNVVNQLLFAIKAEDVADAAIEELKKGKKPIIAFASTMESFLSQVLDEEDIKIGDRKDIRTDFALILKNGLDGVMRYTEVDQYEIKHFGKYSPSDLSLQGQAEYYRILGHIEDAATGIYISPIDIIVDKIESAGFSVHEVTGRKSKVQYNKDKITGKIVKKEKINVFDAYSDFNNNEVDALLINQSGSTGASAQAMVTDKVPYEQVKQRVMIVLQMELNIDTEIQKRGRIDRTGQIYLPEYIYIVSAIPAEMRLMMMMSQKLKSLDANTSSNQNQNKKMVDVPDYLNKYGDEIVVEYIRENPLLFKALGTPDLTGSEIAHKISGRMAVMSTKDQENFYSAVVERYLEYIDFLKQTGDYDLEVEELNLEAKTISKRISIAGRGGYSSFGADTFLEKVEVNVLKKPFKGIELKNLFDEVLKDRTPEEYASDLLKAFDLHSEPNYIRDKNKINLKYDELIKELKVKHSLWKIQEKEGDTAYEEALSEATFSLEAERESKLKAIETKFNGMKQSFYSLVKFFKVGRPLSYQQHAIMEPTFATFIGFDINDRLDNPYAPSAIKMKFAIASSLKYLVLSTSQTYLYQINGIRGASEDLTPVPFEKIIDVWNDKIKDQQKNRTIRYIKTGNLLQAALDGKLISYTTDNGKVKKGILLPEAKEFDEFNTEGVIVPLLRAEKYIQSRGYGKIVPLSNNISIVNQGDKYVLRVPASNKLGGKFFMNKELIDLTIDKKFEKIGDTMRGNYNIESLSNLLSILSNMTVNITIGLKDFEKIENEKIKNSGTITRIKLPPKEQKVDPKVFKLRAKAVQVKMKMILLNQKLAS